MAHAEEHLRELLKLSVEERAHAAKVLLDSLDEDGDDPDADADAQKTEELLRRASAVQDGTAELVDADEARRRIEARLRDLRSK